MPKEDCLKYPVPPKFSRSARIDLSLSLICPTCVWLPMEETRGEPQGRGPLIPFVRITFRIHFEIFNRRQSLLGLLQPVCLQIPMRCVRTGFSEAHCTEVLNLWLFMLLLQFRPLLGQPSGGLTNKSRSVEDCS